MNTQGMLPFENMVADYINETGNHVAYRITPLYKGNNLVCSGVQMEAFSIEDNGEGICFNVYCYNVQPGVTINYATGESSGPQVQETTKPSTTKETTTRKPSTTKVSSDEGSSYYVWIPNSGKKYHSHSGCSNMKNPSKVTESEAINMGYGRCSKCW
jgi:DNA-entry nuclease